MRKADRRQDKARGLAKADERRRVALRVFQGCDDAATRTLAQLDVPPTCTAGCAHCCSWEVPVSRAEVEVLVAWLAENATAEELAAIRDRLRAWLAWYRTECVARVAAGESRVDVFFKHGPPCALLVDHQCSAYPVRPVTCRNMFVRSPRDVCDPAVGSGDVALIEDFGRASYPHVAELREVVEKYGGDYLAGIHLLPEWLAHLLGVEKEPWIGSPAIV